MVLSSLCEIFSRKFLEIQIYKKLFSDFHLLPCLDTPTGWFYCTGFPHSQFLCLLIGIVGLSPLEIPSLESLAACIKTRPKYLIESSFSAQTGSAICVCSHFCLPGCFTPRDGASPGKCAVVPAVAGSLWVGESLLLERQVPAPGYWRYGALQTLQLLEAGAALVMSSKCRGK